MRGGSDPPAGVAASTVRHRVPFYETDAMGVVHHANYVRYLEIARISWLDEHDQPYGKYIEMGRHFATTRVEVDYKRPLRFDDTVEMVVWLDWVRNASLRLCYALRCEESLVAIAATEHALVDMEGRPRRIPRERRDAFAGIAARAAPGPGEE